MDSCCWSELCKDLLEEIAKSLRSIDDYIRFRAVCVSWRSMVLPASTYIPTQYPWLMLPHPVRDRGTSFVRFFSLLETKKIHKLEIAEIYKKFCWGSSHGWLFIMEEESPKITLFNPITRCQIQLPPLTTFPDVLKYEDSEYRVCDSYGSICTPNAKEMARFFIRKVVLSSSPTPTPTKSNNNDYAALAIYNEKYGLALFRPGNKSWTRIDQHGRRHAYDDIIYYKGQFYAVESNCAVVIVDVGSPNSPKLTQYMSPDPFTGTGSSRRYLVDSSGELLLVCRFIIDLDPRYEEGERKAFFAVFKLDQGDMKWAKVKSLGNRVLFIGPSNSISLLVSDFPGCKPNCIYFADDYRDFSDVGRVLSGHGIGIYNLEDSKIESLPCHPNNVPRFWPPTWIMPSLS